MESMWSDEDTMPMPRVDEDWLPDEEDDAKPSQPSQIPRDEVIGGPIAPLRLPCET